ncbi:hypothetical protein [Pseudomonas fluorescens]|uniref:hypothetical protein n=1 Tax=Pseudomonas fluorescens TaxID=294 RepID=UPI00123F5B54|nr:hypothetical protein [Pseudomonas fluorescens]
MESYAQEDGYICRLFIRAEFLPPEPEFSDTQAEFDRVCAWMKQTEKTFPKTPSKDSVDYIEPGKINPMTTSGSLIAVFDMLETTILLLY